MQQASIEKLERTAGSGSGRSARGTLKKRQDRRGQEPSFLPCTVCAHRFIDNKTSQALQGKERLSSWKLTSSVKPPSTEACGRVG